MKLSHRPGRTTALKAVTSLASILAIGVVTSGASAAGASIQANEPQVVASTPGAVIGWD